MFTYVYLYTNVYIYMFTYVYLYTNVYIYMYRHTSHITKWNFSKHLQSIVYFDGPIYFLLSFMSTHPHSRKGYEKDKKNNI